MFTLIGSIIVFLMVILLHELGHFLVAKSVGIKVDEFSIGMGPEIFKKKKGETEYSLRLLPIGGYVAMDGEDEYSNNPRSFNNVSVFKRMAVVVAGVCMNFILAIVAFFFIGLFTGTPTTILDTIIENSPAQVAELKVGDKIIEVNGVKVSRWSKVKHEISSTEDGQYVNLKIQRENEIVSKKVKPEINNGEKIIGINPKYEKSFLGSVEFGFDYTLEIIKSIFYTFKLLFTGNLSVDMFAGPVGVIKIIGQETAKGPLNLLRILGFISANLAIVNLLPIPALDGGKLIFLAFEAITKKKISAELEGKLSYVGFSLLMGLMLYITIFGDLKRIFIGG